MALRMRFPEVSLETLCALFGKSRQAYYRWRQPDYHHYEMEEILLREVRTLRQDAPWVSASRLYAALRGVFGKENMPEWESFGRLLKRHGLKTAQHRFKGVDSIKGVESGKSVESEERGRGDSGGRVWYSEVVHVPLRRQGVAYVHLVWDGETRRVLGWKVGDSLSGHHSLMALRGALKVERVKGSVEGGESGEKWGGEKSGRVVELRLLNGMGMWYGPYVETLRAEGIRVAAMNGKRGWMKDEAWEDVGDRLKRMYLPRNRMTELSDVYFAIDLS